METRGPFKHGPEIAEKITVPGPEAVKINEQFDELIDVLTDIVLEFVSWDAPNKEVRALRDRAQKILSKNGVR